MIDDFSAPTPVAGPTTAPDTTTPADDFEELLDVLKRTRGFDFTGYKRTTLMRRTRHRMDALGINTFPEYTDRLELYPEEFTALFDTVLINVTSFFRDEAAWNQLRDVIIPRVLNAAEGSRTIRIWSAGCASGEEIYGLAMLFAEALGEAEFRRRIKIYGTDIDEDALQEARTATFPEGKLQPVPAELRKKYFEPIGSHFAFRRDLRRSVICGRNDLTVDAPISRVDLLVCRNTLMYFTAETQARILSRFHFALADHGFLFLGKPEMVLGPSDLFAPVDLPNRLFEKLRVAPGRRPVDLDATDRPQAEADVGSIVQAAAMAAVPVAQLVVDNVGRLVLANPRAEALLGLHPRDVGRAFQDLEVSYRPVELRSLIEQVQSTRRFTQVDAVRWSRTPTEEPTYLDVHLTPLFASNAGLIGVAVTFTDITDFRRMRGELQQAHHELERAYEELQSTNEELETTNEELQSTIEELETTNEELHSTNEELETMNHELVVANDSLYGVNSELQDRTDEFNQVSSFLQGVLSGLGKAVIVVDRQFRVHRWSPSAQDLWGLAAEEVENESLLALDIGLPVQELADPLRAVLGAEQPSTKVIEVDARNRRGKQLRLSVQLSQLREGDEVSGAILLMNELEIHPDGQG